MAEAETIGTDVRLEPGARERVLNSAYELFSRRGIRDVGVDEVIERAAVAKATLYRHFPSKDDLVLAFLQRREQLWTQDFVEAQAKRRGSTPEEQLLAIFDVFDDWFRRDDFEACSFINVLLEMGSAHPAGKACVRHLENIRSIVLSLAEEAGLRDLDSFARSWHILMKGSIVSAAEGDAEAAQRAKSMARLLIDQHSQRTR
jgi:AcrR family transcriptional regulator